MFTIKEPEVNNENRIPEIQVKTKIFKAVPIKNTGEESMFVVSTARKSNIQMSYNCSECGVQVRKRDLETCSYCGGEFCSECLQEHDCEGEDDEDW